MNIRYKPIHQAEDIALVAQLADEIWREHYVSIISMEQIDYMLDKYQSIAAITDQIHQEGYEYFLFLVNDSAAAGYMAIQEEEEQLFLSKFYVQKEHRGKGYASQAVRFLEQLCTERGLRRIWLTVNRYNESSIAVYKSKGFRVEREQVADIGNGFVMDDFIMVKEIGVPSAEK